MELRIEQVSKHFKDKEAVNDVSLTLSAGVWGLLGANGAGKTTLMRMIADIMAPTNGKVYITVPIFVSSAKHTVLFSDFCHRILDIHMILP